VVSSPGDAAHAYRHWVADTFGPFASVTSPIHAAMVGHPRRIAALAGLLTAPLLGPAIASTWAIYWNDLMDGASRSRPAAAAGVVQHLGQVVTIPSRVRRSLRRDLGDRW
jgi:hypothetical protein